MPIRVTNLRLSLDEPLDTLPEHLGRLLGVAPSSLDWRILRKSLDTRDKRDIHFVCNAEVRVPADEARVVELARRRPGGAKVELHAEPPFELPEPGDRPLTHR
ncbi:MAG TPA: FAD-dependent oxidoreductase, partial [Gemmataceae bacterium]|nr:FAD-dependent oxidoreductase [Gemmataceae bacterium]